MENFNIHDLRPFAFLMTGSIFILLAIFRRSKQAVLKTKGKKAEGIIFSLERSRIQDNDEISHNIKDKVTVRFLTESQEWITAELKQDYAVFYTNQYKEGDTIQVYYDPQNPSSFFVDTNQSEISSKLLFAVAGLILFGIGLYQLLVSK